MAERFRSRRHLEIEALIRECLRALTKRERQAA